jgi:hypothetical protein
MTTTRLVSMTTYWIKTDNQQCRESRRRVAMCGVAHTG